MIINTFKKCKLSLLEWLVIITIGCILLSVMGSFIFGVKNIKNEDSIKYMNPQLYQAMSMEKMANEMARQNDLNQKRLELMEQQKENK